MSSSQQQHKHIDGLFSMKALRVMKARDIANSQQVVKLVGGAPLGAELPPLDQVKPAPKAESMNIRVNCNFNYKYNFITNTIFSHLVYDPIE